MSDDTIQRWVDGYVNARDIEAAAKAAKNKYRAKIQEYLEDRGMSQIKVDSTGATAFFGDEKTRYSYLKEDEDRMVHWLESNGYGGIVKETVHHLTLSKVLQEHEEQGGEIPDFVKVYADRGFQVRRGVGHPEPPDFPGL